MDRVDLAVCRTYSIGVKSVSLIMILRAQRALAGLTPLVDTTLLQAYRTTSYECGQ